MSQMLTNSTQHYQYQIKIDNAQIELRESLLSTFSLLIFRIIEPRHLRHLLLEALRALGALIIFGTSQKGVS